MHERTATTSQSRSLYWSEVISCTLQKFFADLHYKEFVCIIYLKYEKAFVNIMT